MPHERHLADADYRTAACCVHTVQCQVCLEAFLSVIRLAAWWTGRAAGSCQRGSFKVTTAPPPPDFPLTIEEWVRQAAEAGESAKGLQVHCRPTWMTLSAAAATWCATTCTACCCWLQPLRQRSAAATGQVCSGCPKSSVQKWSSTLC